MAQIIAWVCGIGFIYDQRGLLADDYVSGGMWRGKGILYHAIKWFDTRLMLSAAAVVVLTERLAKLFRDTPPFKGLKDFRLSVIPCCVDLERFHPMPDARARLRRELGLSDRFVFVYSGSLGTWYMLPEMLDFMVSAKSRMPNAHLLILTPTDHAWVRERIEAHVPGFKDYTLRSVEPFRMPEFTALADAALMFIMPVFSKFAEFLACGLPVVANTGIGDDDEVIRAGQAGVLVPEFAQTRYAEAAEALAVLLKDPDLARRCRESARKRYALEDGVGKYLGIYSEVYP
jgi:glycosyltransferase involved in cell wall biosynthesis